MRVRTIIAAAVFSSALALVGCSDPEPKEPNGPTKTATPTQVAPTLPEAATKDSEEGAVAFVKHYIELLNYASDTGDVERLREASDPKCGGCNSYVELYESTYANGGYFKDSGWKNSQQVTDVQDGELLVFADIEAAGGTFKEDRDDDIHESRDEAYQLIFAPVLTNGRWILSRFSRQADQ